MEERPHRFIWAGKHHLTVHELNELEVDFDMKVDTYYVLTAVSKNEWEEVLSLRKRSKRRPDV